MDVRRIGSTKPTLDGGRGAARDVLATGATAVTTYNDLLAIGLMRELQVAGIVLPDALSIVGFDDIFGADFTASSLTTIRSPLGECGALATAQIMEIINGSQAAAQTHRLDTELILRGSSGRRTRL